MKFGGLAKAARAWQRPKSTVQRWKKSGHIHPDYYPGILEAAVTHSVVLDARDFNLVDVNHPAFNAPCTPSPDSTAPHGDAASPDPNPEIPEPLTPSQASDDRIDAAANAGG
jgi:hypothetical protein